MKFCKKCVQPDSRPGIKFNEQGICPGCQYVEKAQDIDWEFRKDELKKIVQSLKKNVHSHYDCIIGVSGGKDSTRQAMYVKEELGLKPLLVSCTYPPEQQTERGAYNLGNMISLGFDTIAIGPAPKTWKKLMREGFLKYGNWAKSTEMALFASVPRVAIAHHIPLIFWGENPAMTLGELGSGSWSWDGNQMKNINTIKGGPDSFLNDEISKKDIIWYYYPSDEEMEQAKLQLVYLGYFWKDWSKIDNANYSIAHGIEIRNDHPGNTGSLHQFECLDEDFVVVNQMIKHLKFGFGKVTDEVNELIRLGKMKREEAIELIKKYDGKCSRQYIKNFCDYIEITEEEFWGVAESFRNKDIWKKDEAGNWKLKFSP